MAKAQTPPPLDRAFEAKVRRSKWALVFEQFWPRLWIVFAVAAVFLLVTLLGVWSVLPDGVHYALLGLFAAAGAAAVVFALRVPWPSREAAIRRLERMSDVAHRPASSYEDTMSAETTDPATAALWQAHRERLAGMLSRLKVGSPQPKTHDRDPLALRAALLLGVVLLAALAGTTLPERIASAWTFEADQRLAATRVDAWVTPPPYTAKPPIMLADGATDDRDAADATSTGAGTSDGTSDGTKRSSVFEVPANSVFTVRASGEDGVAIDADIAIDILTDGPEPKRITPTRADAKPGAPRDNSVTEIRHPLTKSGRVRVFKAGAIVGSYTFAVVDDEKPTIAFVETPTRTERGTMSVNFKVADDYGVTGALARVSRVAKTEPAGPNAWARRTLLKGPRPPHERPPTLTLNLPRANTKSAEAKSSLELGSHPWAGLPVRMTLEATDVIGQIGQSEPIDLILPQRQFNNPIARAVIEQRRKLVDDPRYRDAVTKALGALTLEPEGFIKDARAYLLLRSAFYRLQRDQTREGRNSVVEQLWHAALRIEDGDLSDAERRLREAQEKLAEALRDGASEQEIKEAMKELRQALNEYMRELQKQAQNDPQDQQQNGNDDQNQTLNQQDLERMMKELEEKAKNGSREEAQKMLAELRDLLDQLKSGQKAQQQSEQSKQAQKQLDDLSNMIGEQQKLQNDTFNERRNAQEQREGQQGERGEQGEMGRQGMQQPGQQGQQQQGSQGQPGQQGQQQPSNRWGQRGQDGQGQPGQKPGREGLKDRQQALQNELDKLRRQMDQLGNGQPENLEQAQRAMDDARQALENNELAEATRQQGNALDQMRQGAKQMAQEMMEDSPQRYGQSKGPPRDPLGRPQRSEGPDQGNSVKVPDQIDMQRARKILEELRDRLGDAQRPDLELKYIERLLERF